MRSRKTKIWPLAVLLLLGGGYAWHRAAQPSAPNAPQHAANISAAPANKPATAATATASTTNRFSYRLANTTKTVGQLTREPRAILLENALLDTAAGTALPLPANLRAPENPGSYIVQARGGVDDAFRAALRAAGAKIVSYIPNNAYLVTADAAAARQLQASPRTQAVLAFAPYFKLKSDLLQMELAGRALPMGATVNLLLFPGSRDATVAQLAQANAPVIAEEQSLVGTVLTVQPSAHGLAALAAFNGVHEVELVRERKTVNDLSRVRLGIATNTLTTSSNYLGLTGTNVIVNVNDEGLDTNHPDLSPRVICDFISGSDTNFTFDGGGHGTHVAGIIASSGGQSATVTNASGSVTNADFRGKAPQATIFAQSFNLSGAYLQETAAQTNADISNNSWGYIGDHSYGLASASFDAAVRDALPGVMGSQPLAYVFAAGNDGGGSDAGVGGTLDTIIQPGTAKNVISVGAVESYRNIVSTNPPLIINGSTNAYFLVPQTDSSNQVASYSSRGNVGVGIEGDFGRFKPDVVAPGSWIVSTRSTHWDAAAYYNPTNGYQLVAYNQFVTPTNELDYGAYAPPGTVQAQVDIYPKPFTPLPLPRLEIYTSQSGIPSITPANFAGVLHATVGFPPDVADADFFFSVFDAGTNPASYDVALTFLVTNNYGNYFTVVSNLNNGLGPYYRYESGTSMAAPAVSGTLALIEDYFKNRVSPAYKPSPALLKAMLINGARTLNADTYSFQVNNTVNYQGWGIANLPNSLPASLSNFTSQAVGSVAPMFIFDQSPANALATGQSITYNFGVTNTARNQPLRFTLVWTDPPGDPAAGVKLVNDLDLVVTNLDDPANPVVYFGNDIAANSSYNLAWATNTTPNLDVINNVENVYLRNPLGTNYSVTVVGRHVNVNAVTAHTNDTVQDFALVVSSGDGAVSNALQLAALPAAPSYTFINPATIATNASGSASNGIFLASQHVGASTPLLGTNLVVTGVSNLVVGITNQWHFYVFTNNTPFTNVAFATFLPPDLSLPRIGTRAGILADATRSEADIDLFVTTNAALTNLDLATLTNCINNVGDERSSVGRGGTEFVVYSNSVGNNVYYVGVQSQDQMGAEYEFFGVASELPFSQRDSNGNLVVRGVPVPQAIPDAKDAKHPGQAVVVGIATEQIKVRRVAVTNGITHELVGDLFGELVHGSTSMVLNNHNPGNGNASQTFIYDDSGENGIPGAQQSDGPGSLRDFTGKEGSGVWLLLMQDNAASHTGRVDNLTFNIAPQQNTNLGAAFNLQPGGIFNDFVDVPADATNLTISVSGITQPVAVYVRRDSFPDLVNTNVNDANAVFIPPGGSININRYSSPPLSAGTYYVTVQNIGSGPTGGLLTFRVDEDLNGVTPSIFTSTYGIALLDDAVTNGVITVADTNRIVSVNVGVRIDHPRESDLALSLISPAGTRVLLAENRGGLDTNGYGSTTYITNFYSATFNGGASPQTNIINTVASSGILNITYNFYRAPDQMTIYYGTNVTPANLIYDTGFTNNPIAPGAPTPPGTNTIPQTFQVSFPGNVSGSASTYLTIVMNQYGNPNTNTAWTYTATAIQNYFNYFTFTEDTNLTVTPMKYFPPPFKGASGSNVFTSGFETVAPGIYTNPATVEGWSVDAGFVEVTTNDAHTGTNSLALGTATISSNLPTVAGHKYSLSYAYELAPGLQGLVSWWKGENNSLDTFGLNNGNYLNGSFYTNGIVGSSFKFTGNSNCVEIPHSSSLVNSNYSVEAWINPASQVNNSINQSLIFGQNFGTSILVVRPGTTGVKVVFLFGVSKFSFYEVRSTTDIPIGKFSHVVGTWDGRTLRLYINGVLNAQSVPGASPADSGCSFFIGGFYIPAPGSCQYIGQNFNGTIDEVSYFSRALQSQEIQSIYAAGAAGKCGMLVPPAICGNAFMQVGLAGVSTNIVASTNSVWNIKSQNFKAPQNGTRLQFTGLYSGMLLDTITLTDLGSTVYAQPESPLSSLTGEYANGSGYTNFTGSWQLEVWDKRVGAFIPGFNSLLGWQLSFVYENTVPLAAPTNALALPSQPNYTINELTAFAVNNAATNSLGNPLIYSLLVTNNADGSVVNNAFINSVTGVITWTPDETQGPGSYTFVTTATDLVAGVSATNTFGVYVYEVNTAPVLPAQPDYTNYVGDSVFVDDSATDSDIPVNPLTYQLLAAPPGLTIDTNGYIYWTPTTNDIGTNLVIVQVTDLNTNAINTQQLSATNQFNLIVLSAFTNLNPNILAFPTAEGAGSHAVGGRAGGVYHVTNTNDSGAGSLRAGLTTSHRTIVFDVSGTITLSKPLKITQPYITIAGQTAPGDGITIRGWTTSVQNTHDVVIRYIRFRPGDINCPGFQDDAFHTINATNVILDHVTASWSIDESLSSTWSTNISIQWSMVGESLNNSCHVKGLHGYGSLLRYANGTLTFHHDLYADNYSRNPRPGDNIQLDFVNNVVFNWGIKAGYNEDDTANNPSGYTNYLNYVANYFVAGTNTTGNIATAFDSGVPDASFTQIYQTNNFIDSNVNGVLDGADTGWAMFGGLFTQLAAAHNSSGVTNDSAAVAYEKVLDFSGMIRRRDSVDIGVINGVRQQNGFIINSQNDVGGWPVLTSTATALDTDQDGMPDFWETTLGFNPNSAADGSLTNSTGYTHLEDYLNWLGAPHALVNAGTPAAIDLMNICGNSGNLAFAVTAAANGTASLTNSAYAWFTPTNGTGFASFSFYVTNLDTGVSFGPVDVSVFVSAVAITPAAVTHPQISGVSFNTATGVTLRWNALAGQQFKVQWTTNLTTAAAWRTFTNVVSSPDGSFSFRDNGLQSGDFVRPRYYRLRQLP